MKLQIYNKSDIKKLIKKLYESLEELKNSRIEIIIFDSLQNKKDK